MTSSSPRSMCQRTRSSSSRRTARSPLERRSAIATACRSRSASSCAAAESRKEPIPHRGVRRARARRGRKRVGRGASGGRCTLCRSARTQVLARARVSVSVRESKVDPISRLGKVRPRQARTWRSREQPARFSPGRGQSPNHRGLAEKLPPPRARFKGLPLRRAAFSGSLRPLPWTKGAAAERSARPGGRAPAAGASPADVGRRRPGQPAAIATGQPRDLASAAAVAGAAPRGCARTGTRAAPPRCPRSRRACARGRPRLDAGWPP